MRVELNVPEGSNGPWHVQNFEVTEEQSKLQSMRAVFNAGRGCLPPGTYTRLQYGDPNPRSPKSITYMSNTPDEVRDHLEVLWQVQRRGGHVLINGLGLGVVIELIKEYAGSITVVEISEPLIELVGPTYPDVEIIHADAFEYQPPKNHRYSVVWHDIWPTITADNLDGMHKLHRKYGRRCDWQGSWCRDLCERQRDGGW